MRQTVEIYIAMDSEGDYGVASDDFDTALENLTESYGAAGPVRVVKVTVHMDAPTISEAEVTVPADAGQTVTAEVA